MPSQLPIADRMLFYCKISSHHTFYFFCSLLSIYFSSLFSLPPFLFLSLSLLPPLSPWLFPHLFSLPPFLLISLSLISLPFLLVFSLICSLYPHFYPFIYLFSLPFLLPLFPHLFSVIFFIPPLPISYFFSLLLPLAALSSHLFSSPKPFINI